MFLTNKVKKKWPPLHGPSLFSKKETLGKLWLCATLSLFNLTEFSFFHCFLHFKMSDIHPHQVAAKGFQAQADSYGKKK